MGLDLKQLVELGTQKRYEELVKKMNSSEKEFDSNAESLLKNILPLDIQTHSLLFCYVISGLKININNYQFFDKFLKCFDEQQVKLGVKRLTKLAGNYIQFMSDNQNAVKTIRALQSAITKLNSVQVGLTQLHIWLLNIATQTRMYKQALVIIRQPIVNLEKKNDIDEVDLFIYYYQAGQILTACKQFKEAQQFFEDCFSFQQRNIHEVHIDAKKKLILLNLRKGKFEKKKEQKEKGFRRDMGGEHKVIELSCDAYLSMSNLENISNIDKFDQYVAQNLDLFNSDGNSGLVNQCRFSIIYYYLKQLKQVYLKYKVQDLWAQIDVKPNSIPINVLLTQINKIKPIFIYNQKLNCIEFKTKDQTDHENQILNPLANSFDVLKNVFLEFQKEHQENVKERLKNPGTTYC